MGATINLNRIRAKNNKNNANVLSASMVRQFVFFLLLFFIQCRSMLKDFLAKYNETFYEFWLHFFTIKTFQFYC